MKPADISPSSKFYVKSLFEEYYTALCRFVFRMTNDRAASEDLVQDLFVQIWERHQQGQRFVNPKAYLFQAASNKAITWMRKGKLTSLDQLYEDVSEPATAYADPAELLEAADLEQRIESHILRLPEATRAVFLLSRQHQMTYKEIAEALEISQSTVEKHMIKALGLLKKALIVVLLTFFPIDAQVFTYFFN
jgi:RNA polymerase sigma-70 factor (ECF subfamily)